MVKSVYVPEAGGIVDFADDLTPTEISTYINTKYPRAAAGTAVQESDNSSITDRMAYGLGTMFTEIPGGVASLMYPASREEETWGGRFSKSARELGQRNLNIDPTKTPTTTQQFAQGIGSLFGFAIPGALVAKGVSAAGAGVAAARAAGVGAVSAQGAAVGAEQRSEQIRNQLASGMQISEEQQLSAQRGSALIGTLEGLPMGKFFEPIGTLLSKVPVSKAGVVEKILENRLSKIIAAGTGEGLQEAASGVANDLMEYGVYNPNVEIGQDLLSNAAGGAFAGSLLESVIQFSAGRKVRGARQLQADLQAEAQKNSEDLRKISIAEASNTLAQSGVQGNVTIEPNETPEGSTVYTLTGPDKKAITQFQTEEDATQAVDLYKKMTGAAVNLDVSAPPKLSAIRIGNQKFPTLAAAADKHRKLKDRVNELVKFGENVDLVSKVAAQEGVAPQIKAKQISDEIVAAKRTLSMFDRYFSPDVPEAKTKQEIKVGPKVSGAPVNSQAMPVEQPAPKVEAAEKIVAESGPVLEEPTVEEAQPEEDYTETFEDTTPVTAEEEIPDMPIGAVEMPVEESRVLPDTIVEEDAAVAAAAEPAPEAPTVTVKRPSATDADLINLQEEMFGGPIGVRNMTPEQKSAYDAERDRRFPPQDVDVYSSAGRLRDPAPRNLREAQAYGPAVKDYSPETKAWMKNVYTQLEKRLEAIIPNKARIEFRTLVGANPEYLIRGQASTEVTPNGIKGIIDLATGTLRPDMTVEAAVKELVGTLNHEMIHVLRDQGVIRPEEWRMLSRAVAKTNIPGKKYTYLDKAEAVYTPNGNAMSPIYNDPDVVVEEAVAEMYREWVLNGLKPPQQATGIFNRITEFFRRIFQTLRNARHEEFFKQIESGEVGRREGTARVSPTKASAGPVVRTPGSPMSSNLNDRTETAFGLYPYLRTAAPRYYTHKRMILGGTNPGNAAEQIANLDILLARHPNTLASDQAFADYLADAAGKLATEQTGVPIVPYAAVKFANDPSAIARQLARMTPGQLQMAEGGLNAAKDFEAAYRSGTATPTQTAKLILWGILSRGVSPFVQESMFLDVVKPTGISNRTGMAQGGIDQFINDAVNGEFDLGAYNDYIKTLKLDGLPGAGTTHNLGAFGKTTLVKLQQRIPDGRTILQYLHDLISDYSLSGKEIRRRFHEVNPGIGINNKVLSFMMLVSGRDDVLVLDRVQMRNQFNNGLFDDYNMYDGEKIEKEVTKKDGTKKLEKVTDTGTGIAPIGDGVFGLMYYEALERDLTKSIRQAYNLLGRGNQFSMGRYHWESWVATSSQEVDHGSVTGLIKEATGEADPYGGIYTGEGKYDTFNSGIRYGYTKEGEAYVALPDGMGKYYFFTPEFAKKVIKGYSKASTRIISDANFKVSESTEGPWYDRPEVNKERLRQYLRAQTEIFRAERGNAFSKRVSEIGETDTNGSGPGPVHANRRRIGGVRQPFVTHPKLGTRFSAAPINPQEFQSWFKNSKAVNPDGTPQRWLHGTPASFKQFGKGRSGSIQGEDGPFFFSQNPEFTEDYSLRRNYAGGDRGAVEEGGRTIPVYLSVQNPFDYQNPKDVSAVVAKLREMHENGRYPIIDGSSKGSPEVLENKLETLGYDLEDGDWPTIEKESIQRAIRELGYDGFFVKENKQRNLAVYRPEQVKSIFNTFEEGTATSPRFSAAPLPPYVQQQNGSLFAPAVNVSTKDKIFSFFSGRAFGGKTLNTLYGQIEISGSTMAGLAGKEAVTDKNAYIAELEKLLNQKLHGNYQRMEANYSATAALAWRRRSSHIFASMLLRGNVEINFDRPGDIQSATIKVVDDADSMKEIFNIITEKGPTDANGVQTDKSDIFRSYAVARRGEWLRASGQNVPAQLTPQYIREVTDFTRREYPEVVEAYNKYQRFNKKLLTTAKDAGIISQAELGRLTNQMNYYGFIYEAYGEPLGPTSSQKTASKFKLRPYTGTQAGGLTSDPMFVMMQNAQFWVDSIAKNIAANKAFELTRVMGESRLLGADEAPDELAGEAADVMFFSQNGVVKRFAVKDPSLVIALGSDDRLNVGRFWEMLGLPTYILRESVTRDPGFMARNLLRDTVSAWVTSGADFMPVIDTIKGGVTALKDGASYRALGSYGVVGSYDLAMLGPAELAAVLRRNSMPLNVHTVTTKEGAVAALGSLWNRLGHISEASDAATRIAVYDAAKKQGLSDAEAAMQAIELLDFTRRGGSQTLGILTKLIPFLNARIQGMDVLYQAGRSGIRYATGRSLGERDANVGKKFLLRGGMLAVIATALEALNQGDEDYEQLDEYIKTGNLIVPLKPFGLEGQFLAIPKAFEVGLLFNTIPQQIYKTTTGEASTRENAELFWGSLQSTFGVNPIPQAILPAIEILTNHSFYTGLPLISEGKLRLDPSLQYNSSTSQIAMMLGGLPIFYDMTTGKFGGMSPIVIDKLISGYGGPLGTYLVQATSFAMEGAAVGPERMPTEISSLPIIRSFFIDAKSKNPKVVTQAYELFRIADEANRTMSRLRQMGDAEALANYVDKNKDVLQYKKYIFTLADRLNKLSAQERSIERDESMSRDEKLAAQQKLREIRIRLASQVEDINKTLGR
jgi:hypothetical protein